jgi:putative phosphoribosyl transferase
LRKNRTIEEQQNSDVVIILAIPRGGVIIGDVISSILYDTKLDIIVSRKIRAPDNSDAIGAVLPDDRYFLNEDIVSMVSVSQTYIRAEVEAQTREIETRLFILGVVRTTIMNQMTK